MDTLDTILRLAAIAVLLAIALRVLSMAGLTHRSAAAALFGLSVASYMLASSRTLFPLLGPSRYLIMAGGAGVPMFFWWFSGALFNDGFRLRPWQYLFCALFIGYGLYMAFGPPFAPELLNAGTLVLHHPFDSEILERQMVEASCDTLVAPAPLALRLDESDLSTRVPGLRNVIGLWRAPEQVASSTSWSARTASLTDVYLFGEAGMFGARRGEDGTPAVIKPGPHGAPHELPGSSISGEILLTPRGTLGLRGPMVTIAAYAPPPPPSDSLIPAQPRDYVDTDYAARLDRATGAINITAPPSGIMAVGGYRFLAQDLQEWAKRLGQGALLTALPDRLSGHRLAGRAPDNARAREALSELGLNPLMVEAFRDRSGAA